MKRSRPDGERRKEGIRRERYIPGSLKIDDNCSIIMNGRSCKFLELKVCLTDRCGVVSGDNALSFCKLDALLCAKIFFYYVCYGTTYCASSAVHLLCQSMRSSPSGPTHAQINCMPGVSCFPSVQCRGDLAVQFHTEGFFCYATRMLSCYSRTQFAG